MVYFLSKTRRWKATLTLALDMFSEWFKQKPLWWGNKNALFLAEQQFFKYVLKSCSYFIEIFKLLLRSKKLLIFKASLNFSFGFVQQVNWFLDCPINYLFCHKIRIPFELLLVQYWPLIFLRISKDEPFLLWRWCPAANVNIGVFT